MKYDKVIALVVILLISDAFGGVFTARWVPTKRIANPNLCPISPTSTTTLSPTTTTSTTATTTTQGTTTRGTTAATSTTAAVAVAAATTAATSTTAAATTAATTTAAATTTTSTTTAATTTTSTTTAATTTTSTTTAASTTTASTTTGKGATTTGAAGTTGVGVPGGQNFCDLTSSTNGWDCFTFDQTYCSVTIVTNDLQVGSAALRLETGNFWDITPVTNISFYARALNTNNFGWQGPQPVIVFRDNAQGTFTYTPTTVLLPTDGVSWVHRVIALSDSHWVSRGNFNKAKVISMSLQHDTYDNGFSVDYDGLQLTKPCGCNC